MEKAFCCAPDFRWFRQITVRCGDIASGDQQLQGHPVWAGGTLPCTRGAPALGRAAGRFQLRLRLRPLLSIDKPGGELRVPHRYWVQDEDCLNLNIWTPACDAQKRPVMVWLHGGGFLPTSSIEQVAYEGGNMAREGDCVVVSLNHRLNILGYLDLSDFGEEYATRQCGWG